MKKIVTIIIVFFFIYPVFLKMFPIPLDRCLQLMGAGVLLLHKKDLVKFLVSSSFYKFLGISFLLFFIALLAQLQIKGALDLYFIKMVLDTFFSVLSAYLVCWAIRWSFGTVEMGVILYCIVIAAIIQTVISGIFFINGTLFEVYLSLLKEETNQGIFSRLTLINKRFIGFGSQFFSGVIKYGIAFFSILVLPYLYNNKFTQNRILYWGGVLLIVVGGVLTGRTFFIAIALGILMVVLLNSKGVLSFLLQNIKAVLVVLISLPILYFLSLSFLDADRYDIVFNFIFEMFINLSENEGLSTSSSEGTLSMYIYPESTSTWLFGDGKMQNEKGGYYMKSDVGYIRLLFYFGLPSTLFFVFVLYRYFRILSKQTKIKTVKYFLFFVTLWMLVLNFKGLVFESHYYVLFLMAMIFSPENIISRKYDS